MVKKLLKHEFIYYIRTFILFIPIVLVLAAMTRVFWFFNDYDNIADDIAFTSSVALLIVVCAALLILSTVICIVRFYKNMFTSEGYLTFTLPITNAEHIFVKLFVGMVGQAVFFLKGPDSVFCFPAIDPVNLPIQESKITERLLQTGYFFPFHAVFERFGTTCVKRQKPQNQNTRHNSQFQACATRFHQIIPPSFGLFTRKFISKRDFRNTSDKY